jgi:hypothetical protein
MLRRPFILGLGSAMAGPAFGQTRTAKAAAHGRLLDQIRAGRSRTVFALQGAGAYEGIIAYDIDPEGRQAAIAGPTGNDISLVDLATGKVTSRFKAPFVGGINPIRSQMRYAGPSTLCWTTSEGGQGLKLVTLNVNAPTAPTSQLIGDRWLPQATLTSGDHAFILLQKNRQSVLDFDLTRPDIPPQSIATDAALGFSSDGEGRPFAIETMFTRDESTANFGQRFAHQEATRFMRLRSLDQTPTTVIDLPHLAADSQIVGLPGGGWAILAAPQQVLDPKRGSRLVIVQPDGRTSCDQEIAPPWRMPSSIVTDGAIVYTAFLNGDQPVKAFDLSTQTWTQTPAGVWTVSLFRRGDRLYYVTSRTIEFFGA